MNAEDDPRDSHFMAPRSSAEAPISDLSKFYNEPDPRAYYNALGLLDYRTPDHVQQLARWCLAQIRTSLPDRKDPWIIDIGCGYGANGAGLLYGVPIREIMKRYNSLDVPALSPNAMIDQDVAYFSSRPRQAYRIAGLDVSRASLDYGLSTGLLDVAFDDDLTENVPPDSLAHIVQSGALIIESGVPIFVAPYVLDALLAVADINNPPWIITAPPRFTNVDVYKEVLECHGYTMEQVSDEPLPHRRFQSPAEGKRIIAQQTEMGVDCTVEQTTGYIHVDLYLARPRDEAAQITGFKLTEQV